MDFKDYYAALGVSKTATDAEIKQRLPQARAQAPSGSESRRQGRRSQVQGDQRSQRGAGRSGEAPQVRRAGRELAASTSRRAPAGGAGGWSPNFGGRGADDTYRTMTPEEMRDLFGDDDDPFSDFFHTFFGGAGAAGTRAGWRRAASGARTSSSRSI